MSAFDKLGVAPELIAAVGDMGWNLPTPVQDEAIPLILGGGDVLAAAETGTGKTGAFALPIVQIVHETLCDQVSIGAMAVSGAGASSSSAGAAAGAGQIRLSAQDRDLGCALTPDGLKIQARSAYDWEGARATVGFNAGAVYFEAKVTDEGLARIGLATETATFNLGTDAGSFGFGGTGKKSHKRKFEDYGEAFGMGDVVGVLLDRDARTLTFTKNGTAFPQAYSLPGNLDGVPLFPAVVLKNAEMEFNFGGAPFVYSLPPGVVGASSANSEWCVAGGSAVPAEADHAPACLILEPTRELAEQVHDQILAFGKYLSNPQVRAALLVGGTKVKNDQARLSAGVDVVVGTPGRIKELLKTKHLSLANIRFFVMDEADQLLSDNGTTALIKSIYAGLPLKRIRVQIMCFSATLHTPQIRNLANTMMENPLWVDLKGHDLLPPTVHHALVRVDPRVLRVDKSRPTFKTDKVHKKDKVRPGGKRPQDMSHTIKLLKTQLLVDIIDAHAMEQAIVFCRTRVDCDNVVAYLNALGSGGKAAAAPGTVTRYAAVALHSGKAGARARNLEMFKTGSVRFLVATDVAARGIDVEGLPFVINYTLPDEPAQYVHRVGRVGRADALGLAISLVATQPEKVWYHTCNKPAKCSNTQDVNKGGCTIWHNEADMMGAIEEHIAETVPELGPDYKMGGVDSATYGTKVDIVEDNSVSAKWIDALQPTVKELASLERSAQLSFLTLAQTFNGAAQQ